MIAQKCNSCKGEEGGGGRVETDKRTMNNLNRSTRTLHAQVQHKMVKSGRNERSQNDPVKQKRGEMTHGCALC